MSPFRLVEYGGGPGGPREFPHVYETVDSACEAAETLLDALAERPHRRPHRVDVVDVWTRETVTRITPYTEREDGVCVACHQPLDPFDDGLPFELSPSAQPPAAQPGQAGSDRARHHPSQGHVPPGPSRSDRVVDDVSGQ